MGEQDPQVRHFDGAVFVDIGGEQVLDITRCAAAALAPVGEEDAEVEATDRAVQVEIAGSGDVKGVALHRVQIAARSDEGVALADLVDAEVGEGGDPVGGGDGSAAAERAAGGIGSDLQADGIGVGGGEAAVGVTDLHLGGWADAEAGGEALLRRRHVRRLELEDQMQLIWSGEAEDLALSLAGAVGGDDAVIVGGAGGEPGNLVADLQVRGAGSDRLRVRG